MVWAIAGGIGARAKEILAALYQIVLGLGGPGLFFLALADSSFLSIPEGNDILIIVLSTGATWERMLYYVAMTTAGSVTGCFLLFSVGRRGGKFVSKRLSAGKLGTMRRLYVRWGTWAIVIPSILPPPTPFKIFVLSAGVFGVPTPRFLAAVAAGRSFRYLMWGVLAVLYGERAKLWLEQNLHTVGIVLALLLAAAVASLIVSRVWGRKKQAPEGAA